MAIIINSNPRAFAVQDVSASTNVNDVLSQLNVGTYSKTKSTECDGFSIVKDDQDNPLTIVRSTYDVLQPVEAFAFLDCLQDELDFTYENAGFTHAGKRLFIQGKLGDFEAPSSDSRKVGDIIDKRVVATTSFDGSTATEIRLEFLRLWCSNGCANWTSDNAIAKVKHTRNQRSRLSLAIEQATGIKQIVQNVENDVALLTSREFTSEQVEQVSRLVFPNETKQAETARDSILSQFSNERLGQFGETAWDCLNAFTAWNSHDRTLRETKQTSLEESAFRNVGESRKFAVQVRDAIDEVYAIA